MLSRKYLQLITLAREPRAPMVGALIAVAAALADAFEKSALAFAFSRFRFRRNRVKKAGMEDPPAIERSIEATVEPILAAWQSQPGALLPVLHDIQEAIGHIPPESVPLIAKALNLSPAEVHGVITYYQHFRQAPTGRHIIRVCCAEACQAVGGEALAEHARTRLEGSDLSVEPVYCLGLCACGPAVQIDETSLHGRVTPQSFDALVAALEANR